MSDADLWEHFRAKGLDPAAATLHVERRRRAVAGQVTGQAELAAAVPSESHGVGSALVRNAGQGISSGFGDEIIAAMMATMGPPPGKTRGQYYTEMKDELRQGVATSRVEHPVASVAGGIGGAMLNPLNKLLGPATAGLSPTAAGAVTGITLGGIQGLGEGTGSVKERLPTAVIGAVVGGLTGAALGKITAKLWPVVQTMTQNVRRALGKGTAPEQVLHVTEAVIRKHLEDQPPEVVEGLLNRLRAKGQVPPKPPEPPAPPITRPGETIEQIAPKGFAVSGPRATPPVPTTPTIAEILGTGQTQPYYPRGGAVEQSMAPYPAAPSPPLGGGAGNLAQKQTATIAEFLQGVTPEELPQRLGTLRALGINLPPNAEQTLLQYLMGPR